jgi:hypothetical protein
MTGFKIGETVKKTKGGVGTIRAIFTTIDGEQCYAVENEGALHSSKKRNCRRYLRVASRCLVRARSQLILRHRRPAYEHSCRLSQVTHALARSHFTRRPLKKPALVVFCLMLAVSPCSAEFWTL